MSVGVLRYFNRLKIYTKVQVRNACDFLALHYIIHLERTIIFAHVFVLVINCLLILQFIEEYVIWSLLCKKRSFVIVHVLRTNLIFISELYNETICARFQFGMCMQLSSLIILTSNDGKMTN